MFYDTTRERASLRHKGVNQTMFDSHLILFVSIPVLPNQARSRIPTLRYPTLYRQSDSSFQYNVASEPNWDERTDSV